MNVFKWIDAEVSRLRKAGHERLADLLDALPDAAVNDDHARVDAMVPEALALAAPLRNPWLEVYIRHWHLQSRVLHRLDVGDALPDAVRLLDLSHEEAARDCPQSICAVQDLCSCYGFIDGAGFAEERLKVTEEALARINPAWACFQCISMERAQALRDRGSFAEALEFIDAQLTALRRRSGSAPRDLVAVQRMAVLEELGRIEEALAYGDETIEDEHEDRSSERRDVAIIRARLLAKVGRTDEAARILPPADDVARDPSSFQGWSRAARALIDRGGMPNDGALGIALLWFARRLARGGAVAPALELWNDYAELAVARGALALASRAASACEDLAPGLVRPEGGLAQVARLRAAIAGARTAPPEASLEDRLRAAGDDPEKTLEVLAALPPEEDTESTALGRAAALHDLGWEDEAREGLHRFLRSRPASDEVARALADMFDAAPTAQPLAAFARELRELGVAGETLKQVEIMLAVRYRRDGASPVEAWRKVREA
jgi:tetratricopeptide (TPR) repeat protein